MGFIGYGTHDGLLTVHEQALEEYSGEEWVSEYLTSLIGRFKALLVGLSDQAQAN